MIDSLKEKLDSYQLGEIRDLTGVPDIERALQNDKNYFELVKLLNYVRPLQGKSELLLRLFNALGAKFDTLSQ